MAVTSVPIELQQLGPTSLGIVWSDGHRSKYGARNLRLDCRCANCVDEWTREKRIKEESIPQDIKPVRIDSVGRYALNFKFSDGHDTGIYTFEQMRALCECEQCRTR